VLGWVILMGVALWWFYAHRGGLRAPARGTE
jgi:hypothetical protein